MKNFFVNLMLSFSFFCFSPFLLASNPTNVESFTAGGNVVAVWTSMDSSSNTIVEAVVGTLASNPNTWTITDISFGLGALQYFNPHLFSNSAGDVVILFNFLDSSSNYGVAAAMLPAGTSTWNIQVITDSNDYSDYQDQKASIDSSGNVLATWTSYNSGISGYEIRGAITTIGASTTWGSPFTIAQ